MAVTSVNETWPGRDGTFENVIDNTITRTFLVKTDTKTDSQLVIKDYFATVLGIAFLSPHPENGSYTVRRINVTQKAETPTAYDISIDYSTEDRAEADEDDETFENPLNRPTRIAWGSEFVQEFSVFGADITLDNAGDPVVAEPKLTDTMLNSAGFPFEATERDFVRWTITFRKNFAILPSWVTAFVNKVNDAAITIQGLLFAPRTLKLTGLSISEAQVQNDITFFEVTATMSYDVRNWDLVLRDAGIWGSDGKRIKDEEGNDVTEPWPLDGAGAKLGNPPFEVADLKNRTFKIYEEADFSELPL